MNPEKVGNFIKKLRKENNLTQKDLALKYNVTYQAVSKWENGINLPDIMLIKQMSKDFNVSMEDLLDGKSSNKVRNNYKYVYSIMIIVGLVLLVTFLIIKYNNKSFDFKTISTTCEEFKVSGSIAYDKNKSSIYISHIDYCGGDDKTVYKDIECSLYENNNDNITKISSCLKDENITIEKYLKNVFIKVDNYKQVCNKYNNNSLYLEINGTLNDNRVITYKIPLSLNSDC